MVQAKCIKCHVEDGRSGHTRLVFVPSTNPEHEAENLATFEHFIAEVEDGASRILNKIQGVGHGGGVKEIWSWVITTTHNLAPASLRSDR